MPTTADPSPPPQNPPATPQPLHYHLPCIHCGASLYHWAPSEPCASCGTAVQASLDFHNAQDRSSHYTHAHACFAAAAGASLLDFLFHASRHLNDTFFGMTAFHYVAWYANLFTALFICLGTFALLRTLPTTARPRWKQLLVRIAACALFGAELAIYFLPRHFAVNSTLLFTALEAALSGVAFLAFACLLVAGMRHYAVLTARPAFAPLYRFTKPLFVVALGWQGFLLFGRHYDALAYPPVLLFFRWNDGTQVIAMAPFFLYFLAALWIRHRPATRG